MGQTGLSTGNITLRDGSHYKPLIIRGALNLNNFTTGSTAVGKIFDTRAYRGLRVWGNAEPVGDADSTLTIVVRTGPTTATINNYIMASNHQLGFFLSGSTLVKNATYKGVDNYTYVALREAGGNAASTAVEVDVELF